MSELSEKDYVVVVQCDIVKQRCSGYFCEKAFNERTGGFAAYPRDKAFRVLTLTCGGCCGRAVQRKLSHLARKIKQREGIGKDKLVVQLSSCITKDNFHAPPCPHLGYIKTLIGRLGIDVREDTSISELSEKRRAEGIYASKGAACESD